MVSHASVGVFLGLALALAMCGGTPAKKPHPVVKVEPAPVCDPAVGLAGGSLDAPDSFATPIAADNACPVGKAMDPISKQCRSIEGKWVGQIYPNEPYSLFITPSTGGAFGGWAGPIEYGVGRSAYTFKFGGAFDAGQVINGTLSYWVEGPDTWDPISGGLILHGYQMVYNLQGLYNGDRIDGAFKSSSSYYPVKLCREGSSCCTRFDRYAVSVYLETAHFAQSPCDASVTIREGDYVETLARFDNCRMFHGGHQRPGTYQLSVTAAGFQPYTETLTVNADCLRCNLLIDSSNWQKIWHTVTLTPQ